MKNEHLLYVNIKKRTQSTVKKFQIEKSLIHKDRKNVVQ